MVESPLPEEAFRALYETARTEDPGKGADFDRWGAELAGFPCGNADPAGVGWGIVGGAALLLKQSDTLETQPGYAGIRQPIMEGFAAGILFAASIGARYIDGALPRPGPAAPHAPAGEPDTIRRQAVEGAVRMVPIFLSRSPGQPDPMEYVQSAGPWQGQGLREHLAAAFPAVDLTAAGWALLVIGALQYTQGGVEAARGNRGLFKSKGRKARAVAPRIGEGISGALLALAGDACLAGGGHRGGI
ncbi:MAG: hypothetical protein J2P25_20350 [Nocardiopsaceae bacterium]|nr:hypothetical protein [Nocardiopsaceae bacterium]